MKGKKQTNTIDQKQLLKAPKVQKGAKILYHKVISTVYINMKHLFQTFGFATQRYPTTFG